MIAVSLSMSPTINRCRRLTFGRPDRLVGCTAYGDESAFFTGFRDEAGEVLRIAIRSRQLVRSAG